MRRAWLQGLRPVHYLSRESIPHGLRTLQHRPKEHERGQHESRRVISHGSARLASTSVAREVAELSDYASKVTQNPSYEDEDLHKHHHSSIHGEYGNEDLEFLALFDSVPSIPRPPIQYAHAMPKPIPPARRYYCSVERFISSEGAGDWEDIRADWLDVLGSTKSLSEGWAAFEALQDLTTTSHHSVKAPRPIPLKYLHRLAGMFASARPPTRDVYIRLHEILVTIQKAGGTLHLWEWTALIHAAGSGTRKLMISDVQRALDTFADFLHGIPAGTTIACRAEPDGTPQPSLQVDDHSTLGNHDPAKIGPEVVTYTALLDLAVRTQHIPLLQYARTLIRDAGIVPNVVTHRVLLRHFTRMRDLPGVRDTLARIHSQGLDLGKEGVNAAAWAFGYNGHLDVADAIYRVLREPYLLDGLDGSEEDVTSSSGDSNEASSNLADEREYIETTRRYLAEREHIVIPQGMVPDVTTYTLLIQVFAFRGRLVPALRIFHDMLTTLDYDTIAAHVSNGPKSTNKREDAKFFKPVYPIYRALFLGFAKHAVPLKRPSPHTGGVVRLLDHRAGRFGPIVRDETTPPPQWHHVERFGLTETAARKEGWTHDQLYMLFKSFVALPEETRPSERVIWWILRAFERATDGDKRQLRNVFKVLERRFGGETWGGRLQRIRALVTE